MVLHSILKLLSRCPAGGYFYTNWRRLSCPVVRLGQSCLSAAWGIPVFSHHLG